MGDLIRHAAGAAGAMVVVPGIGRGVLAAGSGRTLVAPSRAGSLPGPAAIVHTVTDHSRGTMSATV